MHRSKKTSKRPVKKQNPLLFVACAVALAALALVTVPRLFPAKAPAAQDAALFAEGEDVVIEASALGKQARYYDYDAGGTTVELFAIKTDEGDVRVALNTCQVCNGSPYAYFTQEQESFICQNCRNRFSSDRIGLEAGGCNPVPVTEEVYSLENDSLVIPADFLEQNAARFKNWKQF